LESAPIKTFPGSVYLKEIASNLFRESDIAAMQQALSEDDVELIHRLGKR
jgi:hypothetical protein